MANKNPKIGPMQRAIKLKYMKPKQKAAFLEKERLDKEAIKKAIVDAHNARLDKIARNARIEVNRWMVLNILEGSGDTKRASQLLKWIEGIEKNGATDQTESSINWDELKENVETTD